MGEDELMFCMPLKIFVVFFIWSFSLNGMQSNPELTIHNQKAMSCHNTQKSPDSYHWQKSIKGKLPGTLKITPTTPLKFLNHDYTASYFNKKNRLVGSCNFVYYPELNIGEIITLGVKEKYRHNGCGKILLKRAIKRLLELGCSAITLDAAPDFEPSYDPMKLSTLIAYYNKFGFTVTEYLKTHAFMEYKPSCRIIEKHKANLRIKTILSHLKSV